MTAPATSKAANKYKLLDGLPVRSVNQPTSDVLAIPAILPKELTSAIPAAAAAPVKNVEGRLQNEACAVDAPAAASVSAIIAMTRP